MSLFDDYFNLPARSFGFEIPEAFKKPAPRVIHLADLRVMGENGKWVHGSRVVAACEDCKEPVVLSDRGTYHCPECRGARHPKGLRADLRVAAEEL